jgi:hypothetical protein
MGSSMRIVYRTGLAGNQARVRQCLMSLANTIFCMDVLASWCYIGEHILLSYSRKVMISLHERGTA